MWLNLIEYFWILRQRARRGGGDSDDEGRSRGKKRKESSQKGERLTEKQRRKIRSKAIISSSEDSDSDGGKKLKIAYVFCVQSLKLSPMTEASKIRIGLPKIIEVHAQWASMIFPAAIMIPFLKYKEGAIPWRKLIKRTVLTK